MKLRVSHLSRYEYAQTVSFSPHTLYLRPQETPLIRVSRFKFNVAPHAKLTVARDAYDNAFTVAHFWDRANALNIRTEFEVETLETNPFEFLLRDDATNFPFAYDSYERYVLGPYLAPPSGAAQSAVQQWLQEHRPRTLDTVPFVTELNHALYGSTEYKRRDLGRPQEVAHTLKSGGNCRDIAAAFIDIARYLGVATRFVSGYLYSDEHDTRRTPQAMHAWAEVYLPGAGWKGVDPTHGVFCADRYIPVAHAPLAECVSPVQGSYYSAVAVPSHLQVNVLLEKLPE